jgi:hypothetical protein
MITITLTPVEADLLTLIAKLDMGSIGFSAAQSNALQRIKTKIKTAASTSRVPEKGQ